MMKDNLLLAISIYVILTIIGCVVLAVPGVTFAVFAGILFGPILGTFACLIATTLGASMAFIVGRFFLKDMIKPMLEKNKILVEKCKMSRKIFYAILVLIKCEKIDKICEDNIML